LSLFSQPRKDSPYDMYTQHGRIFYRTWRFLRRSSMIDALFHGIVASFDQQFVLPNSIFHLSMAERLSCLPAPEKFNQTTVSEVIYNLEALLKEKNLVLFP